MSKGYFAVEQDPTKLGKALLEKIERFQKYVRESGYFNLLASMHRHYHGIDRDGFTSHEIDNKGKEGELAVFNQNFLRELITHYRTLAQGQRAALEPLATDEDYESEMQKVRAKGVLEHSDRKSRLEELRNDAIEYAAVYGVGWLRQKWDPNAGGVLMPGDLDSLIPPDTNVLAASDSPRIPEDGSNSGLSEDQMGVLEHRLAPRDETVDAAEKQLQPDAAEAPAEPKQDMHEGGLQADVFLPTDVAVEVSKRDANHNWWLLRTRVNRHDLAASFPNAAAKILKITDEDPRKPESIDLRFEAFNSALSGMLKAGEADDQIECWELWHKRTPACPNGRVAYMLSDGTVIEHRELEEEEEPCVRYVAPGRIINTPFFYTPAFDLLSPQEALNMLQSIALTNQRAHGVGIILMPQGSNLVPEEITTGLAVCEYIGGLGEPKAMNFTSTPAEVMDNMDRIEAGMQKVSGINGTIRGDPEANLKSGSALVFVQSQAVQYASSFQNNIVRFYEASATDTIKLFQWFMPEQMVFELVGEQEAVELSAIGRDQIDRICRVRVEVVNPMMHTLAGRQTIADGMIKNYGPQVIPPGVYWRMMITGRMEPATRLEEKRISNLKKMCQMLARGIGVAPPAEIPAVDPMSGMPSVDPMTGQPAMMPNPEFDPNAQYVRPLATDDHRLTAQYALSVLDSPTARSDKKVVMAVLSVVRAHKELLTQLTISDPGVLEMTMQPPLQSAVMGMMGPGMLGPGGPEGGAPSPGGPPGGGAGAQSPAAVDNSPPGPGAMPKMPQMPRNPMTGKPPDAPNLVGQQL